MEYERVGAFVAASGLPCDDTPRGSFLKSATIGNQTHQCTTNDGDLECPWLGPAIQRALLGALVVLVCIDVVHPIPALHETWWLAYFLLWTMRSGDLVERVGIWGRAAVFLGAVLVYAWLVDRSHRAFMSTVGTWTIFSSIPRLWLLSYPMRYTIVAVLVAVVTVGSLRRVVGKDLLIAATLLACLPIETRLVHLLLTPSHKPLVVPIRAFAAMIPVLVMAEAAILLKRSSARVDGLVKQRAHRATILAIYRGRLGAVFAIGAYLGLGALMIPVMRWWWNALDSAPSRTVVVLHFAIFSLVLYGAIGTAIVALVRLRWASPLPLRTNITCLTGQLTILGSGALLVLVLALTMPRIGYLIERTFEGPQWTMSTIQQGEGIRLAGVLNHGVVTAIQGALARNPNVRFIELDSPGGNLGDGLTVAKVIGKYGLNTYVETGQECASACTFIFVAGRKRVIGAGATLGFHRGLSPFWDEYSRWDVHGDAMRAIQYFVAHGVRKSFAERAESIPSDSIWKPSVAQLVAAGVVTGVEQTTREVPN